MFNLYDLMNHYDDDDDDVMGFFATHFNTDPCRKSFSKISSSANDPAN